MDLAPLFAEIEHLRNVRAMLAREVKKLRAALVRIDAIEDRYDGGDWDEINEAREIARAALCTNKGGDE